ncbi:MAG: prepilin-type N-terminal cleavage/methylation domain-containing protein [Candidatus Ryanbacteria bacterium]|nr:prepilin-type N-terminal cleavage/methylation domain-containing protein [Candidatus Ryanbacteria bacterium]
MYRRALTLIEVVVVLAVLGVLLTIGVPNFSTWRDRNAVGTAARDVESILKLARSKSLASEEGALYGVFFTSAGSKHSLCKNPAASCGTLVNDYFLPGNLVFCPTPQDVTFSKLSGSTQADETVYFYNKNIASLCGNQPALDACILAKTCGGVIAAQSGVIYEKK